MIEKKCDVYILFGDVDDEACHPWVVGVFSNSLAAMVWSEKARKREEENIGVNPYDPENVTNDISGPTIYYVERMWFNPREV